jgi:transcriptional regulator with XRE-family HTH domain
MNINYKIIGKRIKNKREQINMSQMELAERTDLSVPYISYIETGKKKVSLTSLIHIANALSISANDLLLDHLTVVSDCMESEYITLLTECSDTEKRFILDLLSSIKSTIRLKGWLK